MALSLPEAEELPHFERPSFRVKKKIFATMWIKEKRAVLKLSLINQSVFCSFNKTIIYPVEGAWGRQGWTMVELRKARKAMFRDALTTAWCEVAPKKLITKYSEQDDEN